MEERIQMHCVDFNNNIILLSESMYHASCSYVTGYVKTWMHGL